MCHVRSRNAPCSSGVRRRLPRSRGVRRRRPVWWFARRAVPWPAAWGKYGRRSQSGEPALSRETDSSSSGPQGRGGAAYPSGTPPYGSRQYPSLHPSQDAPEESPESADAPQPEEPRTETTLTTRIRINIPGSRPIPPVVMRTPMSDAEADASRERTGSTPRPGGPASNGAPGAQGDPADEARDGAAAAEPAADKPSREKSGSDWFAPRKAPTNTSVVGGAGAPAGGGPGVGPGAGTDVDAGRSAGPAGPPPPRADLPYFSEGSQRAGDQGAPPRCP